MTTPPTPTRRIDVERLRELAEMAAADPRTWFTPAALQQPHDCHAEDANFIAAANPATILALLAELEAARAVVKAARDAQMYGSLTRRSDEVMSSGELEHLKACIRAYDRAIAGDKP